MANDQDSEYMAQVKGLCSYYSKCKIANPVNCERCMAAIEGQKKLLQKIFGMEGSTLDEALDVARGFSQQFISGATSKNYWCFECQDYHSLTSKIGKKHRKLKQ